MSIDVKTDNRVSLILTRLNEGKSKNEIATELGYSNYKSLDMYMKRHGYTWDQRDKYYLPSKKNETNKSHNDFPKGRVEKILFLLKKGIDTKDVAKQLNFDNHRGMATYMKSKGYIWDNAENTFVLYIEPSGSSNTINLDIKAEYPLVQQTNANYDINLQKYITILELLDQNKHRLAEVFNVEIEEPGKIPRYVIPGITITKSVHMVYGLDQLVRDFSKEKNISQREIFEVALIQFFKSYGYKKEIEALLEY